MLPKKKELPEHVGPGDRVQGFAARFAAGLQRGFLELGMLDARSMALFRISLGALIVLDVALRLIDMRAFYTDFGVLPRVVVIEKHNPSAHFSLLMSSGAAWFQAVLFLMTAVSGACLALGYRTRVVAVASWVLLVSIQHRNPVILQGGDVLFRILVLFAMVLPVSNVWSVDARSKRAEPIRPSLLLFAYVAQIASVYIVTGMAKYKNVEWRDGLGLAYSLWLQQYTTWVGDLMGTLPISVLQALSTGTLAVEMVVPLFLFLPWRVPEIRNICIAVMMLFHLIILLTLKVGLFTLISVVGWLPLLTAGFWEAIAAKVRGAGLGKLLAAPAAAGAQAVPRWQRAGTQAVGGLFLVFLVVWNSANMFTGLKSSLRPPWLTHVAFFFGIDQSWEMFSRPITSDGWFMIPAVRADGTTVDLFSGEEYTGPRRPDSISASFPGDRWRKYWRNLLSADRQHQRLGLGRYLCRRGFEEHDPKRRIEALQVILIQQSIGPDGTHGAPAKVLLWSHECKTGLLKKWEKTLPYATLPFPKA